MSGNQTGDPVINDRLFAPGLRQHLGEDHRAPFQLGQILLQAVSREGLPAILDVIQAGRQSADEAGHGIARPDVGVFRASEELLDYFLRRPDASKATGTGMIVCPGGGYTIHVVDHEGQQVARWLNSVGIAAFVLKYRLKPRYQVSDALVDGKRAIRYVRQHAQEFGISPKRVGIIGFSAGGHLAACTGIDFDEGDAKAKDPFEQQSCRPTSWSLCTAGQP
jgi:acetyl esterase/lipase